MTIIKTIITVFDFLFILLLWLLGRNSKDNVSLTGFVVMATLIAVNIIMIWG